MEYLHQKGSPLKVSPTGGDRTLPAPVVVVEESCASGELLSSPRSWRSVSQDRLWWAAQFPQPPRTYPLSPDTRRACLPAPTCTTTLDLTNQTTDAPRIPSNPRRHCRWRHKGAA